jgi:hypothetical protein
MENHQLIDTATAANDTVHTWYRKGNQQSSRLDMILTSIPMDNLRFKATLTIFDHANVSATFGQLPSRTTPIMKDFILGTDEYLIRSEDTIQAFLDRFGTHRQQADQHDNQQEPPHPAASKRDENIDVSNPQKEEQPYMSSTTSYMNCNPYTMTSVRGEMSNRGLRSD